MEIGLGEVALFKLALYLQIYRFTTTVLCYWTSFKLSALLTGAQRSKELVTNVSFQLLEWIFVYKCKTKVQKP